MDIFKLFGNNLHRVRKGKKITQGQLAQKTGVTANYISMIERGLRNPSLATITKLAQGLQVPVPDLFTGSASDTDIKRKIGILVEHTDPHTRQKILDAIKLLTS